MRSPGRANLRRFAVYLAVVGAINLALILARLSLHDGNPSHFAEIGSELSQQAELPSGYTTIPGVGADGQFYLRLALTPFTQAVTEYGMILDNPPYRQQRVLLPLLGWLGSDGGNPSLAPMALIVINALGTCYLAWLGPRLMLQLGRAPAWGLALPLYPGMEIALVRDLTEIVAMCFLASAILALLTRRFVLATVCLCGAVLSRETTVLFVGCLLLASVPALRLTTEANSRSTPSFVAVVPLTLFAGWQAWLWTRWGVIPLVAGQNNLAVPLSGVIAFAAHLQGLPNQPIAWIDALDLLSWTMISAAVLLSLRTTKLGLAYGVAWLAYSLLALELSYAVWQSDWHVFRALSEWFVLSALIVAASSSGSGLLALLSTVPAWLVTAALAIFE